MKHFVGIFVVAAVCSSVVPGQTADVPATWIGTWTLNVQKSTFGTSLFPGAPAGVTIASQTLRIEQTAQREIRLSGDSVLSGSSKSYHDDMSLRLDGTEAVAGPVSFSFRRVDDSNFEIISKLNIRNSNLGEVSRFSFSPDGKTLTETKTQTQREVALEGTDQTKSAVMRTSTFVLVFNKVAKQ